MNIPLCYYIILTWLRSCVSAMKYAICDVINVEMPNPFIKQLSSQLLGFCASCHFLAATKQPNEWFSPSVCPSVAPFWPCFHHRIIMKLSGVITNDRCDVHAKGQGQRSRSQVATQFSRFQSVTPVWIHIWWNDAYSLMLLRRGALLFFKVIRQISR